MVDNLNDKNIIELIQEITPLIYHLISRLKNKEENLLRELIIKLEFPPNEESLTFNRKFKINDENPLIPLKKLLKILKMKVIFLPFSRNFNLLFLLKSQNSEPLRENEEEREKENEEEREEPVINTEQTFKENECVICLINPPNVLFCN